MVIEDDQAVVAALEEYVGQLQRVPRRYRDLARAAETRVVIQIKI